VRLTSFVTRPVLAPHCPRSIACAILRVDNLRFYTETCIEDKIFPRLCGLFECEPEAAFVRRRRGKCRDPSLTHLCVSISVPRPLPADPPSRPHVPHRQLLQSSIRHREVAVLSDTPTARDRLRRSVREAFRLQYLRGERHGGVVEALLKEQGGGEALLRRPCATAIAVRPDGAFSQCSSRSSLAVRDCPRPPRPDSVLPRHFEVDVTERLSMAVGSKYEDIMAEVVRDKRTLARV
jgi:hypothetical protein